MAEVSPERRDQLIKMVADQVVKRGMETPATFFVEMNRPLSFIGGQALVFFAPILGVVFNQQTIEEFARLMEDRKNVDRLLDKIEELTRERDRERQEWVRRQRVQRAAAKGLPPEEAEPRPLLQRVRSFFFGQGRKQGQA
ncbi:MAG: hypothetical protein Q8P31_03290 [Bacillota bacterium]|nr:hypothetical protein [Bacillota bacterium]